VEYCLYIFNSNIDPSNDSEMRLCLREVQKHASELQKEWLKQYIWQRQGFGLEMITEDGEVGVFDNMEAKNALTCVVGRCDIATGKV